VPLINLYFSDVYGFSRLNVYSTPSKLYLYYISMITRNGQVKVEWPTLADRFFRRQRFNLIVALETFYFDFLSPFLFERRRDVEHNDVEHNDVQYNDIEHCDVQNNDAKQYDIQYNDVQHYDIQHNDILHNNVQHIGIHIHNDVHNIAIQLNDI
jgi:hypothetical protein